MNILFLNPIANVGGAERVLIDVVSALKNDPDQHSVCVILLSDGPLRTLLSELGADVAVVPLPKAISGLGDSQLISRNRLHAALTLCKHMLFGCFGLVAFTFRLRRAVKQRAPDILYSNGLKTHLLSVWVNPLRAKLVWHLHDFYGARPAVAILVRFIAKRVDHGIAISRAIEADMHHLVPGLPITVIYNAVDNVKFAPLEIECGGGELDRLAGLDVAIGPVTRFGMVATYANWKGHLVFLEAFCEARKRIAERSRAYLIGGPIYATSGSQVTLKELRDFIQQRGLESDVGLIPFQENPSSVYQLLDVVVHASTRPEPFGLTIAEAMSCGRPVIIAAAGGAKELFEEGVDGLGHTPGDARQLGEAMVRLGNDLNLRDQFGKNARDSSCRKFSQQRFREQLLRLLNSISD